MQSIGVMLTQPFVDSLSSDEKSSLEEISSLFIYTPQEVKNRGEVVRNMIQRAYDCHCTYLVITPQNISYPLLYLFLKEVATQNSTEVLLCRRTPSCRRTFWQWVYHISARFWLRLFTQKKIDAPTVSLRAYSLAWILQRPFSLLSSIGYEQQLLLHALETDASYGEIRVDTSTCLGDIAERVGMRELLPLIPFYTKALFSHIRKEFSYSSFEGKGVFRKLHYVILGEIRAHTAPKKAALALGMGAFWGLTPFHGFHVILGFVSALYFRLNRPLTFVGLNVSFAPFLVVLIPFATRIGELILPGSITESFREAMAQGDISFLWQEGLIGIKYYLVGSLAMAPVGGFLVFIFAYLFFLVGERVMEKR